MRGVSRALLAAAVAVLVCWLAQGGPARPARAAGTNLEVTAAAEVADAACPSATKCTLRKALETANGIPGADPVTIAFSPATFPPASNVSLLVLGLPLPAITRANVNVDATGAGVVVDGSALAGTADGLMLNGPAGAVRGMKVQRFAGACVSLGGVGTRAENIRAGQCGIGVALRGANAALTSSVIGFNAANDDPAPVTVGVLVDAQGVIVGAPGETLVAAANTIGNAITGVRVGSAGVAFMGAVVGFNTIGRAPAGGPAPVRTGVLVSPPASGTLVLRNTIANAAQAGIAVAADTASGSTAGNTLRGNRFSAMQGLSIDLNADGATNANDDGDLDRGGNTLLNHPVITRAAQSRVAGTACAGCTVDLYTAVHTTGGAGDFGAEPLPSATVVADGSGAFAFESPPVTPGGWVAAIATDPAGNTSEFSAAARVGAGVVQCGNVPLRAGWNFAGYFGALPQPLLAGLPPDMAPVAAIYHLEPDGSYLRWLRDSPGGHTLASLEPGAAYWFLADSAFTLSGGFSLTTALPAIIHAGANDVVYLGGGAPVGDALGSLAGKVADVYQYHNDGLRAEWRQYGGAALPAWARDFSDIEPCGAYRVVAAADGTLVPLQP